MLYVFTFIIFLAADYIREYTMIQFKWALLSCNLSNNYYSIVEALRHYKFLNIFIKYSICNFAS